VASNLLAAACLKAAAGYRSMNPEWSWVASYVRRFEQGFAVLGLARPTREGVTTTSLQLGGVGRRLLQKNLSRFTSPLHIEFAFYRAVHWTPPWWNPAGPAWLVGRAWLAGWLDAAVAGMALQHVCLIQGNLRG